MFLISFFAAISTRRGKKCTQKGTASLIQATEANKRDAARWFEIAYTCDGIAYKVMVGKKYVEGVSTETPAGTQVPIWYDPDKPERVIIAEGPTMRKTVESRKRTRKRCLIWMLISVGIMVFASSKGEKKTELPLTTTTIGQFSQEISALAEKTPDNLTFTESIGAPDTYSVTINDPSVAKKVLDILLNTPVSRLGCQVDMAQMQYEEYCFPFGNETFTFGFLPHSYFCYNGKDYPLGENRLSTVCNSLHEMTAEAETAQSGISD